MGTGIQGPSSSQTPYIKPLDSRVTFESIITTGDTVTGSFLADGTTPWRFVGIPDGTGAFDNGDGTFTALVNHELQATNGVVRAHGSIGAFVSRLVIDKDTLAIVSASDLDTEVFLYDAVTDTYTMGTTAFARFCSADLAAPSAFYDAATGLGTRERIYLNGEETDEGRAFAHIVTGANAGSAYELAHIGNMSFENSLASPTAGVKTIVISTDDSSPGQVYVYVGDKTATGTEIEKAGLVGGKTYGIKVAAFADETNATTVAAAGTAFELAALGTNGDVSDLTDAELQTQSETAGITEFLRPEDGAWDPTNANRFYFVTTNNATSPSRLWALDFTDIADPTAGGTVKLLLDGTEGQVMFDNMTVDANGKVYIQEDPGNSIRLAKVWVYDPATDHASVLAEHDSVRFAASTTTPQPASFVTQDEESSGILDVTHILGSPGRQAFLLDVQSHKASADPALVQDGQLLVMYVDRPIVSPPGDQHDFDGDGKSDILFQDLDSALSISRLNGTSVTGSSTLGGFGQNGLAPAIGTGDFDGNGKSDVLLQDFDGTVLVELVGANGIIGGGQVGTSPGPAWAAVETGDFNGDGFSDILFQNTDGTVGIWELDGTTILAAGAVGSNPGPDWGAIGTGDFNGDGKSDILFQHTDGTVGIWELDGTTILAAGEVGPNPGPDWAAIRTGDFTGDGFSDILFQHTDGSVGIWELEGFDVIDGIGTTIGTADPDLFVV